MRRMAESGNSFVNCHQSRFEQDLSKRRSAYVREDHQNRMAKCTTTEQAYRVPTRRQSRSPTLGCSIQRNPQYYLSRDSRRQLERLAWALMGGRQLPKTGL